MRLILKNRDGGDIYTGPLCTDVTGRTPCATLLFSFFADCDNISAKSTWSSKNFLRRLFTGKSFSLMRGGIFSHPRDELAHIPSTHSLCNCSHHPIAPPELTLSVRHVAAFIFMTLFACTRYTIITQYANLKLV